jgi:serine/threonine protein kinase
MPNSIFKNVPDPEALLALSPEQLGGYLLEHLHSIATNRQHRFNSQNLAAEISNQYPIPYRERTSNVIKEGYQWLKNRDYIFDRTLNGFFDFTEKGKNLPEAEDFQDSFHYGKGLDSSVTTQLIDVASANSTTKDPSVVDDDNQGVLLNNRYRLIKPFTKSGFAHTFLAEDFLLPSKRKCVIKQFAYTSSDPQNIQMMLERFEREAVNLERLAEDSDQVPDLYAHFSEDGKFYLVQEYIEGDTVGKWIRRDGPISESTARDVLVSLLRVLKCVHAHSLIHRDIKPDNIVLRGRDNAPFLIDFGAIKEIAETIVDTFGSPSTTVAIGTPGFMPPEQAAGRPNFTSDLYSLGLTAIFMLTSKLPNELNDLRTGEILWRELAVNISVGFAAILDKAIQWNFRERFASAQDMLEALYGSDAVLNGDDHGTSLASAPPNSPEVEGNMPQVATWWLKDFLSPVLEVLNHIKRQFGNNQFELTASPVQPYTQVFVYTVDFFQRHRWDELLGSDVGEYFLRRYPRINNDLESFQQHMDRFDESFNILLKSIASSSEFLNKLIDAYERLVQHERIPKAQFAHFSLEEIAVHLLGQLHLQISNYRLESKGTLVTFTAYTLLGLELAFPINASSEDRILPGFCRDVLLSLKGNDVSIDNSLQQTSDLIVKTKVRSTELLRRLKDDRMDIAARYNATF